MSVRGGDVAQVMLFDREFDPAEGSAVTLILSGYTSASTPTGNGKVHTKKTRKLGGFDGLAISCDIDKGDFEYLQEKSSSGETGNCSITLVTGDTYQGDLALEGDLNYSTDSGQVEVSARGAKFEKI